MGYAGELQERAWVVTRQGSRRGSVSRAGIFSKIRPLERRQEDLARGLAHSKIRKGGTPKRPSPRAIASDAKKLPGEREEDRKKPAETIDATHKVTMDEG